MEVQVDGLTTLRRGTLRYLDMLEDMDKTYSEVLSERYAKRAAEIAATGPPCDSDGDPVADPADFQRGEEEEAFDETYDSGVLHQRGLLTLLHHALEVFRKAAAVVGHSVIGGARPKLKELSDLKDWYMKQGINLEVIPGFELLEALRHRVNSVKHTGQWDHNRVKGGWAYVEGGWACDALAILPTCEETETLQHHLSPAREFVNRLTELIGQKAHPSKGDRG